MFTKQSRAPERCRRAHSHRASKKKPLPHTPWKLLMNCPLVKKCFETFRSEDVVEWRPLVVVDGVTEELAPAWGKRRACVASTDHVCTTRKEPLSLVRHLELADGNYEIAYQLLKERYDNKRLIADTHLESILAVTLGQQGLTGNLRKLVNTLKENTMALSVLGFEVKAWSFLLLHIILRKLPFDLRSRFELGLGGSPSTIPTFQDLLGFLETELRVLETVGGSGSRGSSNSNNVKTGTSHTTVTLTAVAVSCALCRGNHTIYRCDGFNSLTPVQRRELVEQQGLCCNCLRAHSVSRCTSKCRCLVCGGHHHTKLHLPTSSSSSSCLPSSSAAPKDGRPADSSPGSTVCHGSIHNTMLLGTAMVGVYDHNGHIHQVRALIDSGSQVSVITEELAQRLRLPRTSSRLLYGLGGKQRSNGSVECRIASPQGASQPALVATAVVLKHITGDLPSAPLCPSVLERCKSIKLADDRLSVPGPIDFLIGVDLYSRILDGTSYQLGEGLPTAHKSIFGWILMGQAPIDRDKVALPNKSIQVSVGGPHPQRSRRRPARRRPTQRIHGQPAPYAACNCIHAC
ncbi:unnamed protein product [Plutella xylostella]|uniref:(diamondback moth) hypothetical protein n=1 Tax=Plutella xylostella TaxID=51655 RepID=A0A8S4E7D8_PLUXY|nr:unnamed protein product [Plutella xylostella]